MKQQLRAILYFYKSVGLVTALISLVIWYFAKFPLQENLAQFLLRYLIIKIVTDILLWRYLRKNQAIKQFFYTNLGISELRLYGTVFILDLAVFLLFIIIVKLAVSY